MVEEVPSIILKAIGIVRSDIKEPSYAWQDLDTITAEIEIDKGLSEALDGIEQFSHIIVLYWMHKIVTDNMPLKVHPRGRTDVPLQGLFAVRAPHRPNKIGKATVRLIKRRGNTLEVRGLDAIDGSPVIDIKPYIPGYDSKDDATVPYWITK